MNRSNHRPFFLLLLLFAVYFLSFGPVQALYATNKLKGPMPAALSTFYQPVNWLYGHTPLGKPMMAYGDWWKQTLEKK